METSESDPLRAADERWFGSGRSELLEKDRYRMPVGFGRAPGPRNHPLEKTHFAMPSDSPAYLVTAVTDADALSAMLPPGVRLRGEPRIQVKLIDVRYAYWLAGRHYQVLNVMIPVTAQRDVESVDGYYYPVEWHTLGDNMMTAREELGFPALWADVSEPMPQGPDGYSAHASWLGFRFFEMEIHNLQEPVDTEPFHDIQITYKYIPLGYTEGTEASRLIINDRTKYWATAASIKGVDGNRATTGTVREGMGSFKFVPARWEDMPTQYNVVNALAELPLECTSAQVFNLRFL